MTRTVTKVWTFKSSSGNGTYETLQYDDGSTSCNCMGWTRRVQPDGSRTCKHIRMVDQGMADSECVSSHDYVQPVSEKKIPIPAKPAAVKPRPKADEPKVVVRRIIW